MEALGSLLIGGMVYFDGESLPYRVMALSKRYAVCVRKLSRHVDAPLIRGWVENSAFASFTEAYGKLKGSPVYTIVDFEKGVRAPNDLVFNTYDYFSEADCWKTIVDLMDCEVHLSRRNARTFKIDWGKTDKG